MQYPLPPRIYIIHKYPTKNVKKQRLLPFFSALLLCAACERETGDYPSYYSFVTVECPEEAPADYYFRFDDGQTAHPGETRVYYDATERAGHRAVIYFNLLPEPEPDFDHNIVLYGVADILSKEVETADTETELATLGDDPVGIHKAILRGGWLDIHYYFPSAGTGAKHRLSLVDNRTTQPPADLREGYTYLEFRQNANGDTSGPLRTSDYVSYRLGAYDPSVTGARGICLRVVPPDLLGGTVNYIYIDPEPDATAIPAP